MDKCDLKATTLDVSLARELATGASDFAGLLDQVLASNGAPVANNVIIHDPVADDAITDHDFEIKNEARRCLGLWAACGRFQKQQNGYFVPWSLRTRPPRMLSLITTSKSSTRHAGVWVCGQHVAVFPKREKDIYIYIYIYIYAVYFVRQSCRARPSTMLSLITTTRSRTRPKGVQFFIWATCGSFW